MQNNSEPQISFTHPQLRIVKTDAISRPTNARLLQAAGARAIDSRGTDITTHLNANLENIDFSVAGQHQVPVAVMDDRGNVGRAYFTLTIVNTEADLDGRSPIVVESAPASAAASQAATQAVKPKSSHRRRNMIIGGLIAIIALVLIIWGVNAHNQAQNEAAMASAASSSAAAASSSSEASSRQAALTSQNSGLSSQVSSLKEQVKALNSMTKQLQQAVTDYKTSNDNAQYQATIASLQQQVSNLQTQVSQSNANAVVRGTVSSQLNKLSDTMSDMADSTSPTQASDTLKDSGVNGIISKLESLISSF
ncbi:hypothetical protein [Furfurilactobacillus curtus]|uniref:Uncharacterized protein n=1 Tax=Furfurilactobacillus curtus TaxID=1746200 RepID=A0ABQ5JPD9_9LACO